MKIIHRKNQLSGSTQQENQIWKELNTYQLGRKGETVNFRLKTDAKRVSYLLDEAFKILVRKLAKKQNNRK